MTCTYNWELLLVTWRHTHVGDENLNSGKNPWGKKEGRKKREKKASVLPTAYEIYVKPTVLSIAILFCCMVCLFVAGGVFLFSFVCVCVCERERERERESFRGVGRGGLFLWLVFVGGGGGGFSLFLFVFLFFVCFLLLLFFTSSSRSFHPFQALRRLYFPFQSELAIVPLKAKTQTMIQLGGGCRLNTASAALQLHRLPARIGLILPGRLLSC